MRNGLLQEPSHERKTASNSNAALWWPPCGKVSRCVSWRDGSTSASALSRSGSHVPTANAWTVSIGPIDLAAAAELGQRPLPMSKTSSSGCDNNSRSPAPWANTERPPSGANSTNAKSSPCHRFAPSDAFSGVVVCSMANGGSGGLRLPRAGICPKSPTPRPSWTASISWKVWSFAAASMSWCSIP